MMMMVIVDDDDIDFGLWDTCVFFETCPSYSPNNITQEYQSTYWSILIVPVQVCCMNVQVGVHLFCMCAGALICLFSVFPFKSFCPFYFLVITVQANWPPWCRILINPTFIFSSSRFISFYGSVLDFLWFHLLPLLSNYLSFPFFVPSFIHIS